MELFLNYNYGKVIVSGLDDHVAVNTNEGMQHFQFKGFIYPEGLVKLKISFGSKAVSETSFFGSSGYRLSPDDPWTFCEQGLKLKAVTISKSVFCCINDDNTLVMTNHAPTKAIHTNNVVNLF